MDSPHPATRRACADGLRWLQARLPVCRVDSEEQSGRLLLKVAVVITTLPWLGALLAHAVQVGWPISAAQARWLQVIRSACAAVLLAEWILALAVGMAWIVIILMTWRRRSGAERGTVGVPDARESAPP